MVGWKDVDTSHFRTFEDSLEIKRVAHSNFPPVVAAVCRQCGQAAKFYSSKAGLRQVSTRWMKRNVTRGGDTGGKYPEVIFYTFQKPTIPKYKHIDVLYIVCD